ncbi:hypothetical protein EYF80_005124 [Liparis tanakae]|uniref:Uncharacterized protein n=1 Tax=Liparis tanakae TaxID=230148 RepID=A0A4Z2J3A7_9TELE|nr:hypothetical protein EYF80_005124 [Liparis tanakae]
MISQCRVGAVTLDEGVWQHRTVLEERLALQVPRCENPGHTARASLQMTSRLPSLVRLCVAAPMTSESASAKG